MKPGRHLKIGAGSRLVLRERAWVELLACTTGSAVIGANARVVVVPDATPIEWVAKALEQINKEQQHHG